MKHLVAVTALALLIAMTLPAKAVILGGQDWNLAGAAILTLEAVVPGGNQPRNLPCIICGANQPQQPVGFGYNLFGNTGNADTVSFFSTAVVPSGGGSGLAIDQLGTGYNIGDGSLFLALLGGNLNFSIGLDVNNTGTAQTLESFWFLNLTTHTVLGVFSPEPGGTLVPAPNNGTGFPDYTISGLSLAGINPGDQIIFFARITGANDGPDSFFLIPQGTAVVPLPAAAWLFLSGLLGLGGLAWKRRRQMANVAA